MWYRRHRNNPLSAPIQATAVLAATILVAGSQSEVRAQSSWDETIDVFSAGIARDVEVDGIGSITAAVFVGDEVTWARGFGVVNRDTGQRAGPGISTAPGRSRSPLLRCL